MQRQLPNAELAEKSFLGSIFLEPILIVTAADLVGPDDFHSANNKRIYEVMLHLNNQDQKIDFVSIGEYFNQNPSGHKVSLEYIQTIAEAFPSTDNFETYIDLILDASMKRALIKLAGNISEQGFTKNLSADQYLDDAERKIFNLSTKRKVSDFQEVRLIAKRFHEKTEANRQKGGRLTGLDTGYEALNNYTTGFQPEELIIIAARPGMGKSAFAINLALNIAKPRKVNQKNVAFFSLEMSNEQIVGRMISCLSGIDNMKLRTGELSPDEWRELEVTVNMLGDHKIHFDDSASYTVGEVRAKCRKLKQEDRLDIIIIDYLQLLSPDNKVNNRQEAVSSISRSLKQLAKELQVPIIALSQLSRQVEKREDKGPVLSDLRESGSIEQDADIVIFLHSEDYYNRDKSSSTGEMIISIAKNRQGVSGIEMNFLFEAKRSRFSSIADRDPQ